MTRDEIADALKFLQVLLGRCQPRNGRKDGDGHDWQECDRCLAYLDLESRQPYATKLVTAAVAALAAPRPSGERKANPSQVICPGCTHQFRAIPEDVQAERSSLRTSLEAARAALADLTRIADRLAETHALVAKGPGAIPALVYELSDIEGVLRSKADVLAGSAPPTSEAPADLVALVREWQAARLHIDALNEDGGGPSPEAFEAACGHIDATTTALLAWSPVADAPAPVPAEGRACGYYVDEDGTPRAACGGFPGTSYRFCAKCGGRLVVRPMGQE